MADQYKVYDVPIYGWERTKQRHKMLEAAHLLVCSRLEGFQAKFAEYLSALIVTDGINVIAANGTQTESLANIRLNLDQTRLMAHAETLRHRNDDFFRRIAPVAMTVAEIFTENSKSKEQAMRNVEREVSKTKFMVNGKALFPRGSKKSIEADWKTLSDVLPYVAILHDEWYSQGARAGLDNLERTYDFDKSPFALNQFLKTKDDKMLKGVMPIILKPALI